MDNIHMVQEEELLLPKDNHYINEKQLSEEEQNEKAIKTIDRWIYRTLLLFIGTMPLIIFGRFEYVTSPLISDESLLSSGYKVEFFTHYKFMWTVLITAFIMLLFIWKVISKNALIYPTKFNWLIIVFISAIIVSTLFSDTVNIALYGNYDRSDGAIIWLCYVLLIFIALNIELPKSFINHVMYTLMPFVVINFIMITFNYYGKDFLTFDWFYNALTFGVPDLFSTNEGALILGTLNQWNFMSGMFSMVVVGYFAWALSSSSKVNAALGTIMAILSMLIVLLSVSNSGFLTFTLCLVALVWIGIKRGWKRSAFVFGTFFAVVTPIFIIWSNETPRIDNESIGGLVGLFSISGGTGEVDEEKLEEGFLPVLPEPGIAAGSGRLYIWVKTFDLIKERPLLGYGMDTILYHFPHNNIDARAGLRSEIVLVDKPHNTYLGVWYGAGIVALLCFVTILGSTIVMLFNSIRKADYGLTVLLLFTLAYFIQACFNDSLPSMTALAFLLFGFAANVYLRNRNVENTQS